MRIGRLLACVAALGLFVSFSCAAHSKEGARVESKAQSGNANSAGDEKKVSVSAGGSSVEVKTSGEGGQSGSGDSASDEKKVSVSAGGASVEVKKSGEGSQSVTIAGNEIEVSPSDNESENADVSRKNLVKVTGINRRLSYECKGRSFDIEGKSNTVTLTGECQDLRVSGVSNQVHVETVAEINISGLQNQVTWERGANNKPPKIDSSGINNNVSQKSR